METENQIVPVQNLSIWSKLYNRIAKFMYGTEEKPKVHKDGTTSYVDSFGRYVEERREQSLNKQNGERIIRRTSASLARDDNPTYEEIEILNQSYTVDGREFVRAEDHTLYDSEEKFNTRVPSTKYKVSFDANGGFIKIINKQFDGGTSKTVISKEMDDSYLQYAIRESDRREGDVYHTFKMSERRVQLSDDGDIVSREKTTSAILETNGSSPKELTYEHEKIGKNEKVDYREVRSKWEIGELGDRTGYGTYIEKDGKVLVAQGNQSIILLRKGNIFEKVDQFTLGDLIDIANGKNPDIKNEDVIKVSKNVRQSNHFVVTTYLPQEENRKMAPQLFKRLVGILGIEKTEELHIGTHPEVHFKDQANPQGTNFFVETEFATMGLEKMTRKMVYGEEESHTAPVEKANVGNSNQTQEDYTL